MTPKTQSNRPAWMGKLLLTTDERAAAVVVKGMSSQDIRRCAALDGLERFAKRFDRAAQKDAAKKIRALAEKAEAALTEYAKIEVALSVKRPDPLAVAHEAAADELRKALPVCFPCEQDALIFARRLPLTAAVKAASDAIDAIVKKRREQKKPERAFWEYIAQAGRLAIGTADDDGNIKALIEAGR